MFSKIAQQVKDAIWPIGQHVREISARFSHPKAVTMTYIVATRTARFDFPGSNWGKVDLRDTRLLMTASGDMRLESDFGRWGALNWREKRLLAEASNYWLGLGDEVLTQVGEA